MAKNELPFASLYDLNREVYRQTVKPMAVDEFDKHVLNMGAWFSSKTERKTFMLMCKEISSYTVFHFSTMNYDKGREELREVLLSFGVPLDVEYMHDEDVYRVWMKSIGGEVHMYMLFPYDEGYIEI